MATSTPYQTVVQTSGATDLSIFSIPVFACSAIAAADEITDNVFGCNYQIQKIDFVCVTPITTAAKTATLTPYIDAVAVPGTVTPLAGTKAKGSVTNIFTASTSVAPIYGSSISKFKLTGSAVTAFAEGTGYFNVYLRNIGNLV